MPLLIDAVALDREKIDILYPEDFWNQANAYGGHVCHPISR
ncbi:MAG TPA: hypothetical protein VMG10_02335 [Gemmataceae bacterium]|nr:hypothetical protein [Gemmataceae bacterium]